MRRGGEVARGLLAGLALVTVVVGLPVLLASVVGWPLPHQVPKVAEIADALGDQRVPETATVWKILAVVLWVAWAQVVVSVAIEVAAVVRGGLVRPLRGLGLAHGLVAPLVTAVALAWPAGPARPAGASPAPVPAASAPPPSATPGPVPALAPNAPPAETASPVAEARGTTIEHVVVHRDTLWDLAKHYLGDGYRAPELFEANKGRPQADGSALTDPGLLRSGWVLSIPLDAPGPDAATADVVVRPGDTLWDLAEEHLGDGHRYPEVFQRNAERPQPDGGALVDPDVIEPGWVLAMPAPSAAGPTDPAPTDTSSGDAPTAASTAPTPTPTAVVPTTDVPAPAIPDPVPDAPAMAPAEAAPAPKGRAAAVDDGADAPAAPVGLVGGGVATAGLVFLLERLRRTQQRRRRSGRRLPQPAPEAAQAERELRAGADTDVATQVDVALRAAAAGAGAGGPATLRHVEAGDGVTLALDADAPAPAGFSPDGPRRWRTSADATALARLGAPALPPAPGLVPVGRDAAGTEILIDLEQAGVVSVVGDPTTATSLLRATAVSLMSAPWSEQTRVLLVGFDPQDEALSALAEVTTADAAVHGAERRMERVRAALAGLDCASVAQARSGGVAPESCAALLVIVAAVADQALTALAERVAAAPGHGVAIVMAVAELASTPGRVLVLDADGSVRLDGLEGVRARQLDDADTRMAASLLETASAADVAPPDEAVSPPRRIPRRVDAERDALGELVDGVDVLVSVLGPIEVVRCGPDGEQRLDVGIQKSLEAIVYLALRETAADREELQAALWPAGTNSAKTFQNVVWVARKALGTDRDGADLLPDPVDGRYGLNPRLASTYGLFHELVARADEVGDAGAAADLLAQALTLVHGEPFVGVGRNYAWVAPHAGMIVSQIVDAAEELAEIRLATGDWRGAEWAARQGLRSFPSDERLYRLLMRCAHAAGSVAGVQRVFAELAAAVADPDAGVEPLDTIHAETVALLDELSNSRSRPDASPAADPGRHAVR